MSSQLIKNALTYRAHIPSGLLLQDHLEEHAFVECLPSQAASYGFVEPIEREGLIVDFDTGICFAVRFDSKVVPSSAVKAETDKRCAAERDARGRQVGKKERAEIKEQVLSEFYAKAFVRTKIVRCFYHTESKTLIVPCGQGDSDRIVSLLVRACGSVKTETIWVSSQKQGLTTRLRDYVDQGLTGVYGNPSFDNFNLEGNVELKLEKQKLSIKVTDIDNALEGLHEALKRGFQVESIGLSDGDACSFRLTHGLNIKAISLPADYLAGEHDGDLFRAAAAFEVANVAALTEKLCTMFGYKPKAEEPLL